MPSMAPIFWCWRIVLCADRPEKGLAVNERSGFPRSLSSVCANTFMAILTTLRSLAMVGAIAVGEMRRDPHSFKIWHSLNRYGHPLHFTPSRALHMMAVFVSFLAVACSSGALTIALSLPTALRRCGYDECGTPGVSNGTPHHVIACIHTRYVRRWAGATCFPETVPSCRSECDYLRYVMRKKEELVQKRYTREQNIYQLGESGIRLGWGETIGEIC